MGTVIPLDEQIVATLTTECTADEAQAVLKRAERALTEMVAEADAADVASLSPLATAIQARELRSKAADLRFEADRMDASVSALRSRVADFRDQERRATRQKEQAAALKVRDDLAAEIAAKYPRIVRDMTDLVKRIEESDALLKSVGLNEVSAEAIGRGVPGNFSVQGAFLSRFVSIALPMPAEQRPAWQQNFNGFAWTGLGIAVPAEAAE